MDDISSLRPELCGIQALNAFFMHNSSARGIMFGSHFAQHLTLIDPDEAPIVTELHYEMAKYTFGVRMPDNGTIVKVIPRFHNTVMSRVKSSESLVIYQKEDGEYDCFTIPYHIAHHQYFGFKGVPTKAAGRIREGQSFAKDTTFVDTPGVKEDGSYAFGKVMNVAYMTQRSVAEDGVIFSESATKAFRFRVFHTRTINTGSESYPLNRYGNDDVYKVMPDIGEYVNDDNIVFSTRSYDEDHLITRMSKRGCREKDHYFDRPTYGNGPGGKVVNIEVIGNHTDTNKLPVHMREQLDYYKDATLTYHRAIVDAEKAIRQEWSRAYGKKTLRLSKRFSRKVTEAMAIINYAGERLKPTLNLNHRMVPLDEYRVKITIEYEITPTKAFKVTDLNGGQRHKCLAASLRSNAYMKLL